MNQYGLGYSSNRLSSISADGKTTVLDCYANSFPADQHGPFFAKTEGIGSGSFINSDNTSFHVGFLDCSNLRGVLPMVARADNYGALCFEHILGILKVYVNIPEGYTFLIGRIFKIYDGDNAHSKKKVVHLVDVDILLQQEMASTILSVFQAIGKT